MSKRTIKSVLMERAKGSVNEKILDYVISNFNSVAYMTLSKLCYFTDTTTEEMNAFFTALGYENFFDFKTGLRELIYNEFGGPDEVNESSLRGIVDMVMRYEMINMTEFSNKVDLSLIDRLTQDMLSVPVVYIVGIRTNNFLAAYAAHILSKVGITTIKIDEVDSFIDNVVNMDRSGLVLAFGFSRYHKGSIVLLNMLKKQGFTNIVAVTDYPMSPLAVVAHYSIMIPRSSHDFTVSYVAGTMFLNILAVYIASQDKEALLQRIKYHDNIAKSLEYFF